MVYNPLSMDGSSSFRPWPKTHGFFPSAFCPMSNPVLGLFHLWMALPCHALCRWSDTELGSFATSLKPAGQRFSLLAWEDIAQRAAVWSQGRRVLPLQENGFDQSGHSFSGSQGGRKWALEWIGRGLSPAFSFLKNLPTTLCLPHGHNHC